MYFLNQIQTKKAQGVKLLLLVFTLFQFPNMAAGQDSASTKYYKNNLDRNFLAEIPLWIPGFKGQLAYGDVDLTASGTEEEKEYKRLKSNAGLEFYFVGSLSARFNKIWVQADAFSGKVSSTFSLVSIDASKAYKSAKKKAKKVSRSFNKAKRAGKAYLDYLTK